MTSATKAGEPITSRWPSHRPSTPRPGWSTASSATSRSSSSQSCRRSGFSAAAASREAAFSRGVGPQAVAGIAGKLEKTVVTALARTSKNDIDRAWQAISHAAKPRIHTFIATSDLHLEYKLKMTREQVVDTAIQAVKYAKTLTDDVEFSAEDAIRTEREFLAEMHPAGSDAVQAAWFPGPAGAGAAPEG